MARYYGDDAIDRSENITETDFYFRQDNYFRINPFILDFAEVH